MIEVKNVSKVFKNELDFADKVAGLFGFGAKASEVFALDDVSITLHKGEVLGLVGESGSGKSTLGRIMAGLLGTTSGSITKDVTGNYGVQMVFQDASSALNPRMQAIDLITEAPLFHLLIQDEEKEKFALKTMSYVGLDDAMALRFPHQFSGGQRARLGIARALAVSPQVLILDEAVASLDVSIQAQILNLLMKMRDELQLTMLFISHDLSVIGHIADRVAVLYLGRLVEIGTRDEIFNNARHPYTQSLLKEIPSLTGDRRDFMPIKGEIPSPLAPPSGCHFHPRCALAQDICRKVKPELTTISEGHLASCHLI